MKLIAAHSPAHEVPDLDRLRENDAAAWSLAYPLLWRAAITAVLAKLGASGTDAENLTSDLLCKEVIPGVFDPQTDSFRQMSTFDDLMNVTKSIARNRSIDFIRRSARRREELHADVPELPPPVPDQSEGIEVFALIQRHLSPPVPELFHDRFVLGLTTREIAKKRVMPHGQVCSRFSRALKTLAEILRAYNMLDLSASPG